MTQDVADRMLKHLKQAHDLMRRLFEGSIGDVQMEAIKLAIDAGKDPSVASLRHVVQLALKKDQTGSVKDMLVEQMKLHTQANASVRLLLDHVIVTVDRSITPEQAFGHLKVGRSVYGNPGLLRTVPKDIVDSARLIFVRFGRLVLVSDLVEELRKHGLRLADFYAMMDYNTAHPEFAGTHPNAFQWQDEQENCYCLAVYRSSGERCVSVYQDADGWDGGWWFPCVPI